MSRTCCPVPPAAVAAAGGGLGVPGEITRECKVRGLRAPSRGTVLRRIARLDPVKTVTAREGRDAERTRRSAGGMPPEVTGLLEQVQADHTPVDVIVVDESTGCRPGARTSRSR